MCKRVKCLVPILVKVFLSSDTRVTHELCELLHNGRTDKDSVL